MANGLENLDYASASDEWATITVDKLPVNVDAYNNVAGTSAVYGSSITVTRAPQGTLLPPPGYAVDVYDLWFDYPIDSEGAFPDVDVQFQIGTKKMEWMTISAGYDRLMFPPADRIYRGARVPFAESMRQLYNRMKQGEVITNMPLRITGLHIPAQQSLKVTFRSTKGWGNTATAIRPLVLHMRGDVWTTSELGRFQQAYNGAFSLLRYPSGGVQGLHVLGKALTADTVDMLPNGTDQFTQSGSSKIYQKLQYAINNNTINASAPFVYSQQTSVGGAQQNVIDTTHDLGLAYYGTTKTFIPNQIGFRFAENLVGAGANPQIYVGWYNPSLKSMLPDMHTNGLLISSLNNPFQWGDTMPQVDSMHRFFPMQPSSKLLKLLVSAENWCLAASVISLNTTYDANSLWAMQRGFELEA